MINRFYSVSAEALRDALAEAITAQPTSQPTPTRKSEGRNAGRNEGRNAGKTPDAVLALLASEPALTLTQVAERIGQIDQHGGASSCRIG